MHTCENYALLVYPLSARGVASVGGGSGWACCARGRCRCRVCVAWACSTERLAITWSMCKVIKHHILSSAGCEDNGGVGFGHAERTRPAHDEDIRQEQCHEEATPIQFHLRRGDVLGGANVLKTRRARFPVAGDPLPNASGVEIMLTVFLQLEIAVALKADNAEFARRHVCALVPVDSGHSHARRV